MSSETIETGSAPEATDSQRLFQSSSPEVSRTPSTFDLVSYKTMQKPGGSLESGDQAAGEWQAGKLPHLVAERPAAAVVLMDLYDPEATQHVRLEELEGLARQGAFGRIARDYPDPSDIANRMHDTDKRISSKPGVAEQMRRDIEEGGEGFERMIGLDYLNDGARREAQGEVLTFLYGKDKVQKWSSEQGLATGAAEAAPN